MFKAVNTRTMEITQHDKYQQAVQYLIDNVGQDYKNDFYINDKGKLCDNPHSRLDFGLIIFDNDADFADFMKNANDCEQ